MQKARFDVSASTNNSAAQATSLQNVVFKMSDAPGTQHQGLFIESGKWPSAQAVADKEQDFHSGPILIFLIRFRRFHERLGLLRW